MATRPAFPVLIHHGTPSSSLLYEPQVRDAAERGIRLIAYDRPGYGGSTRNPGRAVADCAADVAAICDALEIERFCTWGISGGGPHVLATAALLPDRVAAAAALASVAPIDAEGLEFTAGMGEMNVESFNASRAGEERHRAQHELELERRARRRLRSSSSRRGARSSARRIARCSRAASSSSLIESTEAGIEPSSDGWFDDDVVFGEPWGFDVASIAVPVLVWHGEQDKFVPFAHGVWLAEHIPGAEARLTAEDGHLTILERRIGEIHDWLLARFND